MEGMVASRWWRWTGLEVAVAVLSFLLLLRGSTQVRSSHPSHGVIDKVNRNGGPYIGLVMAFSIELDALLYSGLFVPNSDVPWVDLSGRIFNIGSIQGVDVIYVMSGEQTLNSGITVQILLDAFEIRGIVHYGIAGSSNDSLSLGDVSVPKYLAFTDSWKWMGFKSEKGELPELKFGAYNLPIKGENLLAKIEFTPQELYSNGEPVKEVFWLEVDPTWFNVSIQLQDTKLQQCVNETYCLPHTPKVVNGLRASTADIFVDNAAFREFLFKELEVSTVDEESAAVVMVATSNGVPSIVFRGVSDLAGGAYQKVSSSLYSLAAFNAFNVAVEFIELIGKENIIPYLKES